MKTYSVSTSAQSHLGQGKMFLVQADDENQVLAWFAMNYGLATIDQESIKEATVEDTLYYQSMGGKVHQTSARQRKRLLESLEAVSYEDHEKDLQEERDRHNPATGFGDPDDVLPAPKEPA